MPLKPLKKLNVKHLAFIEAYVGSCFGNAARSAIAAGYKPSNAYQTGSDLLKDALVQQGIEEAQARLKTQAQLTQDETLKGLAEVIRAGFAKAATDATVKDALAAVQELSKRQGLYAPTKQEIAGPGGTSVFGAPSQDATAEEVLAELEKIKAAIVQNQANLVSFKNTEEQENKKVN